MLHMMHKKGKRSPTFRICATTQETFYCYQNFTRVNHQYLLQDEFTIEQIRNFCSNKTSLSSHFSTPPYKFGQFIANLLQIYSGVYLIIIL